MAASFAMQFPLASTVTRANRNRVNQFCHVKTVPRLQGNPNICVRCLAEDEEEHSVKTSTKFSDLLFKGAVAERINGRMAMIGFVAAVAVELSKGRDLFTQISNGGNLSLLTETTIVIVVASLIPLFRGIKAESSSVGLFTSNAELWNGRFAILGFLALAFAEYLKGGTLFYY